jgi:phage tail-like protein
VEGNNKTNFSYLNRDGEWPDFHRSGLELLDDGSLQLYSVPLLEGELPAALEDAEAPSGPSGIAVAQDGTIFYTDPDNDRIFRIDGCDASIQVVRCIGSRLEPVGLNTPRGLLIPKYRPALFVADSNNNRLQIFDLSSLQLVDIWGQFDPANGTQPGTEPGRFDTPWSLDGDADGNVYVVDYGNNRVQKFNRAGIVVPEFWETMRQAALLSKPSGIVALATQGATLLYILDEATCSVFVFDANGNPANDSAGNPIKFGSGVLQAPMGIAASEEAVYIGDNQLRRVLSFKTADGYSFAGEAVGYQGPVAALAFDGKGSLLVHAGTEVAPVRLTIGKGYRTRGLMWSEAIQMRQREVYWHRLQALIKRIGTEAHLRLFVHTSNDQADQPSIDLVNADAFSDSRWRPASSEPFSDIDDLFIGGEPAFFLWVGALFSGEGLSTPVVSQLRAEFDHESYLEFLPAIYRSPSPCDDVLLRFLSLFETFFTGTEESIRNLSVFFDPAVIPAEFLSWLAGWLALDLDENWDEAKKREAIARAFDMYSRRGTARGLREALRFFAGVDAVIEEPILSAEWWALPAESISCECKRTAQSQCGCKGSSARPKERTWDETENSVLGVTTMLAPAHPQGAVVGATATLDQSHLISNAEFGAPLFSDVADRFTVQLYRGQLNCPETLDRVREVIIREKPAHTTYDLCVIEPSLRIGYQARVGIDAVVAGPPEPTGIGDERGAVLGGQPAARIGAGNILGITTRVG